MVDVVCGDIGLIASWSAKNDEDSDSLCGELDSCKDEDAGENDADSDVICGDVDFWAYVRARRLVAAVLRAIVTR